MTRLKTPVLLYVTWMSEVTTRSDSFAMQNSCLAQRKLNNKEDDTAAVAASTAGDSDSTNQKHEIILGWMDVGGFHSKDERLFLGCWETYSQWRFEKRKMWSVPRVWESGRVGGSPWTSHRFIKGLTYGDKQPSTLTFTPTRSLERLRNLIPSLSDFGLREEVGENPGRHKGNMQTPHRNDLT